VYRSVISVCGSLFLTVDGVSQFKLFWADDEVDVVVSVSENNESYSRLRE
jgi:hypothetical protein